MMKKICIVCGNNKTSKVRSRYGKEYDNWYLKDGKPMCFKCYSRLKVKYRKNHKVSHCKSQKKYHDNNLEKTNAHSIVANNNLRLKHCEKCNANNCRLEGHHFDYSRPKKIITLCVKCHKEIHRVV